MLVRDSENYFENCFEFWTNKSVSKLASSFTLVKKTINQNMPFIWGEKKSMIWGYPQIIVSVSLLGVSVKVMGIIFLYCSKKWLVAPIQEYANFLTFRMFLMIVKYFKGHRISLVETGILQKISGIHQSTLQSLETFWRGNKVVYSWIWATNHFLLLYKKIIPRLWVK